MSLLDETLGLLEQKARPDQLEGMARFGIRGEKRLGVSIPELRKLAWDIGKKISIVVLLATLSMEVYAKGISDHYDVKVRLDPEKRVIRVNAVLTFHSRQISRDSTTFFLHKQFKIAKVFGKDVRRFSFKQDDTCPAAWIPQGRALRIFFDNKVHRTDPFIINFEYEGKITEWPEWSANVITDHWVELGLYLPWFPYNPNHGPFTFTIEAQCPDDFVLRSMGGYRFKEGIWFFESNLPSTDMVLISAKVIRTIEKIECGHHVLVHFSKLREKIANRISSDLIYILKLYQTWFEGSKKKQITLIESLRENGGGYARPGLISVAGISDLSYLKRHQSYIRYLAHEAGHIWWSLAPTGNWQDWLNEGFAEYSALLIVRKMFGERAYQKRIEKKKASMKKSVPIWGFGRNDHSTPEKSRMIEVNLYNKGPVLLHLLSERINTNQFMILCREMIDLSVSSTADFLALLKEKHGSELKNWFKGLLCSY
jgi:hypothetical protein